MTSKTKLLVRGSALRVVNLATTILVAFFMLPFLVDSLGQRYYGMWALIGSIIGYLGYMDFGLSKATQVFIARALGQNSTDEANRVLSTSFPIFSLVGLGAFLLAVVIAIAAPLFLDDLSEVSTFRFAIIILGVNAAMAFAIMAFNGFFSANLRYDIVSVIGISRLLLRSLLIVIVVLQGYGLVAMALVATIIDLLSHLAKLYMLKRMYRQVSLRRSLFRKGLIRPLFTYGGKASLHSVADILRFQVDVLVVGAWLNLSAVAVYAVAGQLAEYFRQLLGLIFGVTIPLYAQLDGKADIAATRRLFNFSSKLALVLSVFLAGNAAVFGSYFIDLWLGPDFSETYLVLVILLAGAAIHASQEPALSYLYGLGEHGKYSAVAIIEGILNVGLSLILVQFYGLVGVALATSISIQLTAGYAFWSVAKKLELSLVHQAKSYLGVLGLAILMHYFAFRLVRQANPDSYVSLFGLAFIVALAEVAILWLVIFSPEEKGQIRQFIKKPAKA